MNDLAVELGNWVSLPTASTPRFSAEARHRRPVLQQHRVGRRTSLQSLPELARWSPLRGAALNVHWSPAFESVLELAEACDVPCGGNAGQRSATLVRLGSSAALSVTGQRPVEPAEDNALICCCRPQGDIVIDL
jgi:hypothetical protein